MAESSPTLSLSASSSARSSCQQEMDEFATPKRKRKIRPGGSNYEQPPKKRAKSGQIERLSIPLVQNSSQKSSVSTSAQPKQHRTARKTSGSRAIKRLVVPATQPAAIAKSKAQSSSAHPQGLRDTSFGSGSEDRTPPPASQLCADVVRIQGQRAPPSDRNATRLSSGRVRNKRKESQQVTKKRRPATAQASDVIELSDWSSEDARESWRKKVTSPGTAKRSKTQPAPDSEVINLCSDSELDINASISKAAPKQIGRLSSTPKPVADTPLLEGHAHSASHDIDDIAGIDNTADDDATMQQSLPLQFLIDEEVARLKGAPSNYEADFLTGLAHTSSMQPPPLHIEISYSKPSVCPPLLTPRLFARSAFSWPHQFSDQVVQDSEPTTFDDARLAEARNTVTEMEEYILWVDHDREAAAAQSLTPSRDLLNLLEPEVEVKCLDGKGIDLQQLNADSVAEPSSYTESHGPRALSQPLQVLTEVRADEAPSVNLEKVDASHNHPGPDANSTNRLPPHLDEPMPELLLSTVSLPHPERHAELTSDASTPPLEILKREPSVLEAFKSGKLLMDLLRQTKSVGSLHEPAHQSGRSRTVSIDGHEAPQVLSGLPSSISQTTTNTTQQDVFESPHEVLPSPTSSSLESTVSTHHHSYNVPVATRPFSVYSATPSFDSTASSNETLSDTSATVVTSSPPPSHPVEPPNAPNNRVYIRSPSPAIPGCIPQLSALLMDFTDCVPLVPPDSVEDEDDFLAHQSLLYPDF